MDPALYCWAIWQSRLISANLEPTGTPMNNSASFGLIAIVYLAFIAFFVAAGWKIFTKACQPGWAVLIPIYNLVVFLQIVGRPLWWILLCFIPLVNFVVCIVLANDLAKKFGKGIGFTLGLIILSPIFYPILGFGSAEYQG